MIAFVFSGGGNRGALEAGAVCELIRAGVSPDLLVGTSAGAINAAYLAAHGTAAAEDLAALWAGEAAQRMLPFNPLAVAARLAQGKSLFDASVVASFIRDHLPSGLTFGQLKTSCYVTTTDLTSGTLYLYGHEAHASVADAVLASAAHPLLFDPVPFSGGLLVDGGVVANAPLGVAIDVGATEIYLLNASYSGAAVTVAPLLIPILLRCLDVALYQPLDRALKDAVERKDIVIHHMVLPADDLLIWDLSHGAELVEAGRQYMRAALAGAPMPRRAPAPATSPPGAVPYVPPWLRE